MIKIIIDRMQYADRYDWEQVCKAANVPIDSETIMIECEAHHIGARKGVHNE